MMFFCNRIASHWWDSKIFF